MSTGRRRIWSEYVPYDALVSPPLLRALASRSIELLVAVTPDLAADAVRVVHACRNAGVRVGLWPMLADADGRWASAANGERFCAFVHDLVDDLEARAALPHGMAIDLEPSIVRMRRLVHGHWAAGPAKRQDPAAPYRELVAALEHRGMEVLAAVLPPVVLRPPRVGRGWQRLLDTPVDAIPFTHLSAMAYTSLFQGYSRGLVRRCDAVALLARLAREAHQRHGTRAGISVGAVGIGALGDEQTYRSVAELVEDVSVVRAAGIEDIALFNLDGVLARPPIEQWLDALAHTPPADSPVRSTLCATALWQIMRSLGRISSLLEPARSCRYNNASPCA